MTKASTFYKRNYTNGYHEKIDYWATELMIAVKYDDGLNMQKAKKKLDHFVPKQREFILKKNQDLLGERIGLITK